MIDGGAVTRIAAVHDVQAVPPERRTDTRARDVMRPLAQDLVARPGDTLYAALESATWNGFGRLAVVEGGQLVGYLSLKDVAHVLALRGVPYQRAETPTPLRRAA